MATVVFSKPQPESLERRRRRRGRSVCRRRSAVRMGGIVRGRYSLVYRSIVFTPSPGCGIEETRIGARVRSG
jgi:hypothetical protein